MTFSLAHVDVRTADLYVRSGAVLVPVEVKAPRRLHWPRTNELTDSYLKKTVKDVLKRASGSGTQLTPERPGVLIIACGVPQTNASERLEAAINRTLGAGRKHSGIVAAAGMTSSVPDLRLINGQVVAAAPQFQFSITKNTSYDGKLTVNSRPRGAV